MFLTNSRISASSFLMRGSSACAAALKRSTWFVRELLKETSKRKEPYGNPT
jgi:hypothetical protein